MQTIIYPTGKIIMIFSMHKFRMHATSPKVIINTGNISRQKFVM